MNKINEQKFYQIKPNRKNPESIQLKFQNNGNTYRNLLIQRKKANILIPNRISNQSKNIEFYYPYNTNISNDIIRTKHIKKQSNNDIYNNLLNDNSNIEEKILLQRPKIKIKMHSLKHNNINRNTISTEKNNNQIKCKIHVIKTKTSKHNNNKIFNLSNNKKTQKNKNNKKHQKKINYGIINMIKDELLNNDKTFINYYNLIQEKSLKKLSNQLDDLIGNKTKSKSEYSGIIRNNESYNNNKTENSKSIKEQYNDKRKESSTNVYRKKIQRKKNFFSDNNIISNDNLLTFENKDNINNYKKIDLINEKDLINLKKNKLKTNRTHKFICTRNNYINPNQNEFTSKNSSVCNFIYNQNNKSIIIPCFTNKKNICSNINKNFQSEIREIKQENINNDKNQINRLKFNNNNNSNNKNKSNTINFIEIIKPEYKNEYHIRKNNYTDIRYKKDFNLETPKSNNIFMNSNNLNEFTHSKIENIFNSNNLFGTDEKINLNLNKNSITLYSNNTSEYNTVNTLNNSDKNILNFPNTKEFDEIKLKFHNNLIRKQNKYPVKNNILSQKKIYIRNGGGGVIGRKNISSNNSNGKKLRNVVTSIEYSNRSNKKPNDYIRDKNIIMSEINENGKINIKVKEMKNSIEKILKEKSFNKIKNDDCLPSPQKWSNILTYVKKNQGTHINKIKKHNTVNNIVYYPPPIPISFQ